MGSGSVSRVQAFVSSFPPPSRDVDASQHNPPSGTALRDTFFLSALAAKL